MGQRDGSEVKSTFCFCRGPGFNSQNTHDRSQPSMSPVPHGRSQPSMSPVPGDPILSSGFCREALDRHVVSRYTFKQTSLTHKIKINLKEEED